MTRRGLFKTLFGGIFAALGWNRIKTRRSWRCIADFKCSSMPPHTDWGVAVFHMNDRDLFHECDQQYKRAWDRAIKSL